MKVEIEYYEADCGYPCTPDGCMGHTSDLPETIWIDDFPLSLPDFVRGDWPFLDDEGADDLERVKRWKETVIKLEGVINEANYRSERRA